MSMSGILADATQSDAKKPGKFVSGRGFSMVIPSAWEFKSSVYSTGDQLEYSAYDEKGSWKYNVYVLSKPRSVLLSEALDQFVGEIFSISDYGKKSVEDEKIATGAYEGLKATSVTDSDTYIYYTILADGKEYDLMFDTNGSQSQLNEIIDIMDTLIISAPKILASESTHNEKLDKVTESIQKKEL